MKKVSAIVASAILSSTNAFAESTVIIGDNQYTCQTTCDVYWEGGQWNVDDINGGWVEVMPI